ncbi:MAG: hypothetical protein PHP64_04195 [Actinomycetota bacterium]|nr:hypothetical protein [Actinomycetota bacterium]
MLLQDLTPSYRKCPLCGSLLEGIAEAASGEYRCGRCGTIGRYEGKSLVAIFIPDYHARLAELESKSMELLKEIELEGIKGNSRDMKFLREKYLERQSVLAEYSFLSYFREFVEKW